MKGRLTDRRMVLAGLSALGLSGAAVSQNRSTARVVVVGGGFGGASAARTLKRVAPAVDVTLVEPSDTYVACPFSNLVVASDRSITDQGFGYDWAAREGITRIGDWADDIDPVSRTVTLREGQRLPYDRLILSPGVDIRWGALEGYGRQDIRAMPHAWKAGAQSVLLRRQLDDLEDGGVVVMSSPPAPYRCPPGPYERASLIAHYLKMRKPRSKLIVLDAKDAFSKKPLFLSEWAARYPDHLEWRGASDDGRVIRVEPSEKAFVTDFDRIEADVANVIPPQQASEIARRAGVVDQTGWCPVEPVTMQSTRQPDIHVIGDAALAAPMPKSAFAANAQGKICALQIAALFAGSAPEPAILANTCYSYIAPDEAISVVGVYETASGAFAEIPGAGGLSPMDPNPGERAVEAAQAEDWFRAITLEAFG